MSEMELPFAEVGVATREAGARLLLGTQRVTQPVAVTAEWKDVMIPAGAEGSEAFGRALGALYLINLAGRGARTDAGKVTGVAGKEEKPLCSTEMHGLLVRVFGQEPSLVSLWCVAAAKMGVLPWPEHVPGLLSQAAMMPGGSTTARAIVQSAGARAVWLIGLNPAWKKLSGLCDEAGVKGVGDEKTKSKSGFWEQWDETVGDRRVRVFESMRMENAAEALERLAKAWPDEPTETRGGLLESLEVGLSLGDEAFLEGLLDDKRKTVREKAAGVLAGLAGSQRAERMAQRLKGCVRISGQKVEIEPPAELDKAMVRDGMTTDKPVGTKMGVKAWLLQQMVAGMPLEAWEEVTGLSAQASLAWVGQTDWSESLWRGWRESLRKWKRENWAGAILNWSWELNELETVKEMLARLRPEAHEEALLGRLERATYDKRLADHAVMGVLGQTPFMWSPRLTEAYMGALVRMFERFDMSDCWHARSQVQTLVECLDGPVMAGYMAGTQIPQDKQDEWFKLFKNVINKIEIRAAIQKEMTR